VVVGGILPLVIFLPAYLSTSDTLQLILFLVFLILGLVVCFSSSFRTLITEGALCMPAAPAKTSSWDLGSDKQTPIVKPVKKIKVIVNPNAGVKQGVDNLAICQKEWAKAGIEVTVLSTTHAGHCREYARDEDLKDVDALCAIGGDGTIHELCNGILARKDDAKNIPPLGFLPGGSGNSVMCDLGSWDIRECAERIAKGSVVGMDVCHVTTLGQTIASINECTFGLVGDIGVLAEDYSWMGPGRYDAVAAWKLLAGFSQHVKLEVIDQHDKPQSFDGHYLSVFLNQTQHFGKGMRAVPHALVDDGLLDLTLIESADRGELLAILNQVPEGRHAANQKLISVRAKSVNLTFDTPGVFNVDGEICKHDGNVKVTVGKRELAIFADQNAIAGHMI